MTSRGSGRADGGAGCKLTWSEKMLRTVLEHRELIVELEGTKQLGVSNLLLTQYS